MCIRDSRTPEQERRGFTLPPGFEITLFASEPQIAKPINMEFDDRGRLWVSHSLDYPMPAVSGGGKDKITILEDTNGDGKADTFTDFQDGLNIPIGIMPVTDGAIAYSIPCLLYTLDLYKRQLVPSSISWSLIFMTLELMIHYFSRRYCPCKVNSIVSFCMVFWK